MIDIGRRQVLRLGVLGATLLGTSTGVARLAAAGPAPSGLLEDFAERYRGRWIRGLPPLPGMPAPRVFVDDVELHVMVLAGGLLSTPLNHYQTFSTSRLAARAAVDSLNGARLLPFHP